MLRRDAANKCLPRREAANPFALTWREAANSFVLTHALFLLRRDAANSYRADKAGGRQLIRADKAGGRQLV